MKQIQERSLINYLQSLKGNFNAKNSEKLDFKMCACTILEKKTHSPKGLAQRSPEGPSLNGESLKVKLVTQQRIHCPIERKDRSK